MGESAEHQNAITFNLINSDSVGVAALKDLTVVVRMG